MRVLEVGGELAQLPDPLESAARLGHALPARRRLQHAALVALVLGLAQPEPGLVGCRQRASPGDDDAAAELGRQPPREGEADPARATRDENRVGVVELDARRWYLLRLPGEHQAAAVAIPDLEEPPVVELVEEDLLQRDAVGLRQVEHPHVAVGELARERLREADPDPAERLGNRIVAAAQRAAERRHRDVEPAAAVGLPDPFAVARLQDRDGPPQRATPRLGAAGLPGLLDVEVDHAVHRAERRGERIDGRVVQEVLGQLGDHLRPVRTQAGGDPLGRRPAPPEDDHPPAGQLLEPAPAQGRRRNRVPHEPPDRLDRPVRRIDDVRHCGLAEHRFLSGPHRRPSSHSAPP